MLCATRGEAAPKVEILNFLVGQDRQASCVCTGVGSNEKRVIKTVSKEKLSPEALRMNSEKG
jgi:hypothetical protein